MPCVENDIVEGQAPLDEALGNPFGNGETCFHEPTNTAGRFLLAVQHRGVETRWKVGGTMAEEQESPLALPEEELTVFSSSEAHLRIPVRKAGPRARGVAALILFAAVMGALNGLDFMSPEVGVHTPHEYVFRLTTIAPDDSATFRGGLEHANGTPAADHIVRVSTTNVDGITVAEETRTDANGSFEFTELDPGPVRVEFLFPDASGGMGHRVLLSPPALFEPIGFTTLDFTMPDDLAYADHCADRLDCIRYLEPPESQTERPLLDPTAALLYIMFGAGFIGLALISTGFAIAGFRNGSPGVLRIAAALSLFTIGHLFTACLFGLLAFALTFTIRPHTERRTTRSRWLT